MPPFTVASLATIMTSRPAIRPMPVTMPAPGASSSYRPFAASGDSSRNGDARIEQALDALAHEQLAAALVLRDQLGAAAQARGGEALGQLGRAGAVERGAFLEHRILGADARNERIHGAEGSRFGAGAVAWGA